MPQNDINNNQASKALYTSAPFSWQLRLAQGLPLDQADGSRSVAADNPPEVSDGDITTKDIEKIVLAAIREDPGFPGMTDGMWATIQGDRDATEEAMKLAVSLTKQGIEKRLTIAGIITAANNQAKQTQPEKGQ